MTFTYRGQILTVHDGDTVRVDLDLGIGTSHKDIDLGFDIHITGRRLRLREDVRLYGCNAIELSQPGGTEAQQHLAGLLPVGSWVTVQTIKNDKYGGRYDAKIALADGRDVTTVMCADGYAAPWDGVGSKPVPAWPPATEGQPS
jgi:endonuclease YncB( thermonuclease family)